VLSSLTPEEPGYPEPDGHGDYSHHDERHPPRTLGAKNRGSQIDERRGEQERQRDPDRKAGYDNLHPKAALFEGTLARYDAPVVRVEQTCSKPSDHAHRHEPDQSGHKSAQDGGQTSPNYADHDNRSVSEPVPQMSARELHQHIPRE